jgi:DNA gyrase subunit B
MGIEGSAVVAHDAAARRFDGESLRLLLDLAAQIDAACRALERRGIDLKEFFARRDPASGALPVTRSRHGGEERWWPEGQRKRFEEYQRELSAQLGREIVVAYEGDADETIARADLVVAEFPEGREASRHARKLVEMGVDPGWVLKGDFTVARGDEGRKVDSLRAALAAVRKLGQESLTLQRYKGLGEMNAEELWETTMDPATRTLREVRLEDDEVAENIFTTLMGDAVEPRRQFIEENALNVRNLDV